MAVAINDVLNAMSTNKVNKDERFSKGAVVLPVFLQQDADKKNKSEDVVFEPTGKAADFHGISVSQQYQYSETMSLKLTTVEGDTVELDFRQLYSQYKSHSEFEHRSQGHEGVRYFSSREALESTAFEEHIGFAVTGDLNEKELQAIYDVFAKVDALANHFFAGDIEQAFQKAVELDVDFSQIGSLNVSMTQTEMKAVQYQQVAMAEYEKTQREVDQEQNGIGEEEHVTQVGDLPVYLQQWQEAIEKLEQFFEHTEGLLTEFVGNMAAQRFPEQDSIEGWHHRVQAFHEKLFEKLDAVNVDASDESNQNGKEHNSDSVLP